MFAALQTTAANEAILSRVNADPGLVLLYGNQPIALPVLDAIAAQGDIAAAELRDFQSELREEIAVAEPERAAFLTGFLSDIAAREQQATANAFAARFSTAFVATLNAQLAAQAEATLARAGGEPVGGGFPGGPAGGPFPGGMLIDQNTLGSLFGNNAGTTGISPAATGTGLTTGDTTDPTGTFSPTGTGTLTTNTGGTGTPTGTGPTAGTTGTGGPTTSPIGTGAPTGTVGTI